MIQKKRERNENNDIYYLLAFFFLIALGYFTWFGDSVFFFQEKQSLFIFAPEFLAQYFIKPGGPLKLAGEFLTLFYINPGHGAILLSMILTLPGVIFFKVNKRLFTESSFSLFFLVVASFLLLFAQTHYYHAMEYNLGFILVLLYFSLTISQNTKQTRYASLAVFPFVYYLLGGYVWIFFVMFIIYSLLFMKGRPRYLYPAFLIVVGGVSFIVFKAFIFIQPLEQFISLKHSGYPLPFVEDSRHTLILYLLTGYLIIYPLLGKIFLLINPKRAKNIRMVGWGSIFMVFGISIFILTKLYNPQARKLFQLQKYVLEDDWGKTIKLHETAPSKNVFGQFFYNISLSETGQLCDRLFFGRQDFGDRALIMSWENKYLNWGMHFYYSIGLINEAHRWAYESMVVYGYQPQDIKMLVKTNLINGNYRIAEKYIHMLKNSFYYSKWAEEYEDLLYDTKHVQLHPELGEKMKLCPRKNFFIHSKMPHNNIHLLLKDNPTNKKAFEYKIALFLLTKNVNAIVRQIKAMEELDYERLPRHVEEAVLLYSNSTGEFPYLGRFRIRPKSKNRFQQYISTYKKVQQNSSVGKQQMLNQFNNTYWFYFHFKKIN